MQSYQLTCLDTLLHLFWSQYFYVNCDWCILFTYTNKYIFKKRVPIDEKWDCRAKQTNWELAQHHWGTSKWYRTSKE